MAARLVTRFAPSPTGRLHRGHAFSALTAHRAAQAAGGRFILRIEDIDQTRCRPEFEAAIHEDLAWLGLAWERPVRRQSEHMADYEAARRHHGGVAIARLDGRQCTGCHMDLSTSEFERVKATAASDAIAECPNCGRLLVP